MDVKRLLVRRAAMAMATLPRPRDKACPDGVDGQAMVVRRASICCGNASAREKE